MQARIIQLLLAGLEGRTWTGKEALLKALADIASAAPENMRGNTREDPNTMVSTYSTVTVQVYITGSTGQRIAQRVQEGEGGLQDRRA